MSSSLQSATCLTDACKHPHSGNLYSLAIARAYKKFKGDKLDSVFDRLKGGCPTVKLSHGRSRFHTKTDRERVAETNRNDRRK